MMTTTKKSSFILALLVLVLFVCYFNNDNSLSNYSGPSVAETKKKEETSARISAEVLHNISKIIKNETLTSAEVLLRLSNDNLTIAQLPYLFPKPNGQDTASIYNRDAWIALRRVLTTRKQFSLCANGGSATAGGGATVGGQFYFKFIDYMNTTGVTAPNAKVDIIERGHGARNSMHSAMLADSFLPPHIDILLWEFSINDESNGIRGKYWKDLEEKNQLILWLEQVSKIKPRPPLVVLAYLWNAPFNDDIDGKVISDNFISHQRVASEYEFVVGHVNLASYIDELQWGMKFLKKFFLVDTWHPSRMGHAALAHLLLDLVVDEDRQVATDANITTKKTPYQWACGKGTGKRFIQSRVDGKHPLASFTMDLPRNEQVYPGMLVSVPSNATKTVMLGRQDPGRLDRKMGLIVPCCHDNKTLDFVVSHNNNITMQLINLGMPSHPFGARNPRHGIRVFLDSRQSSVAANLIITPSNWGCLWGKSEGNTGFMWSNMDWIALENEQQNVSRIQLCSTGECCGLEFCKIDGRKHGGWVLQSLVIY
jgi:hypothetical protein